MPQERHHVLVPTEAHTAVLVAPGDGRSALPSLVGDDWTTSELLAERAALVQQYLSAWTDLASIEELRTLAALAEPLAAVHHAIGYLRILEALEPDDRWYFDEVPAKWLVEAVDAIGALPEVDGP